MNRKVAEMALIYRELKAAVSSVYSEWGIEFTEEDLANVVLQSRHLGVMIRDEVRRCRGGKKLEALYRELGEMFHLSSHTVESIVRGRR